jgi:hypothetical protein
MLEDGRSWGFISDGSDLHHPTYKLAKVQKGVISSGIMILNNLPQNVQNLSSDANKLK